MINTVVRNLISNALKFTRENGLITIACKTQNNTLEVSVSDNGVGLSAEQIKGVFNNNNYVSTFGTDNEKGSGLGLQLCKDLVENNKGKLTVESEPEKGANFKFTLPLAQY